MSLEKKFNRAIEMWLEHLTDTTPGIRRVVDNNAYHEIVKMGKEALPLIKRLYDEDINIHSFSTEQGFPNVLIDFKYKKHSEKEDKDLIISVIRGYGLVLLISAIVGDDFKVPGTIRNDFSKVEEFTRKWLDENISKYLN